MPEDRRLAAIMFTDIVGYTALMGRDEDQAFKILKINREIHALQFARYNGTLIKEMGDGILASFPSAYKAVQCAKAIQEEAKLENILLRIGIHEGEVVFEGGDVLGDGVNVASRLEELAEEGCINISGAVYKDIKNKAGITAEFIEEKTLKNVEEPVNVYKIHFEEKEEQAIKKDQPVTKRNKLPYYIIAGMVVMIAIILIWQFLPSKESVQIVEETESAVVNKSIAVLPFDNLSGDQDQDVMCDGLTEEIIHYLSVMKEFDKVISRSSIMTFKGSNKRIQEIAELLNVNFILEGSYRQSGNRLRITAQLIEASSDNHLWSEIYERSSGDIFDIQTDIAKKIASNLKVELTTGENEYITKKPTDNLEAYSLYLKGRYLWNNRTKEGINEAIGYFQDALEKDQSYALAYVGLADCYIISACYGYIPPKFGSPKGENLLLKAFEIDSNLSEALASLAHYKMEYERDWDGALNSIERAIQLNPNNATAYNWYSDLLVIIGHHDEAIVKAKRAQELDPLSPIINSDVSSDLYKARKFDQAIEEASKALIINPDYYLILRNLGLCYLQKGMYVKAVDIMELALKHSDDNLRIKALLAYVYGATGNNSKAQMILNDLNKLSEIEYVASINFALINIGLKNEQLAIDWLEKSFEEREHRLVFLNSDPIYDPLRSNPRFQVLVDQMNFPE